VLGSADVGATIRLDVTASNAYGTSTAVSAPIGPVAAEPSANAPATGSATFTGTLNAKQTTASFPLEVGNGVAQATLTFSKWASLTISFIRSDGSVVSSASGASVLQLAAALAAGSYTVKVAGVGKGGAAFTLTVTYQP
jgi:uncharacterized protein involved in outer membrane biogenesis